ncbi:MAG: hypothetical protein HC819_22815 [Cyclobacteriaceae bacterium]|nr:hypothetical protein [Cyclobacteriaceae bacterium]
MKDKKQRLPTLTIDMIAIHLTKQKKPVDKRYHEPFVRAKQCHDLGQEFLSNQNPWFCNYTRSLQIDMESYAAPHRNDTHLRANFRLPSAYLRLLTQ